VLTGLVGALGAAQLAAFGIAARLEYLLYPLAFGLGAGVLALVGTNLGAGRAERAVRAAWIAAGLAAVVTGCIGLFAVSLPTVWASLFTDSAELRALTAGYLVVAGLAYPFLGAGLALASAFQAAGRPSWPLIAITSRALAVTLIGWLMLELGTGLSGLALAAAIGLVVSGAVLIVAFRAGLWRAPATG
jgi:Na+-driven multidrug efflux pump